MKFFGLISFVALAACKTTATNESDVQSASAPNPQTSSVNGWAYSKDSQGQEANLATYLSMIIRSMQEQKSPDIACESIDSSSPNFGTDCTISDKDTKHDSIQCYQLYSAELKNAPKSKREEETRAGCTLVSLNWPKLTPRLSEILGSELSRIQGNEDKFLIGNKKQLKCQKGSQWACEWVGFTGTSRFEIPFTLPKMPKPVVEDGAVDDYGQPLPKSFKEVFLMIGKEKVFPSTYVAEDRILNRYLKSLTKEQTAELDENLKGQLQDGQVPKKCRKGEHFVLLEYTGEGYREINNNLRSLKNGKLDGTTELSGDASAKLLTFISAFNCAKRGKAKVVARGAKLDAKKLKKYLAEGTTIQERSATSTTMGDKVLGDFRGNVTFYIVNADGIDLSNFSTVNPETSAEGELLIRPGSMFKIAKVEEGIMNLDGEEVPSTTVYMMQIP